MATHIYPSETPVGQFPQSGSDPSDRVREYQLVQWMHDCKQSHLVGHRLYLGTLSAHSPNNLSVDVAAGYWVVYDRSILTDAIVNVTGLTANATNYIYLQITFTGSLITAASFVSNTTGVPPANSICVGKVVCGASTVSSVEDVKANPHCISGSYTGDGNATQLVFLGYEPSAVEVWGSYCRGVEEFLSKSGGILMSSGSFLVSSSSQYVPVPATLGFTVGVSAGTGLNVSGQTYYYRAWA